MLQERFPAWVEKVEFWEVDDDPNDLSPFNPANPTWGDRIAELGGS
jgi:hypothetical protein